MKDKKSLLETEVCKIGNCSLFQIRECFLEMGELKSALNGGMLDGVIEITTHAAKKGLLFPQVLCYRKYGKQRRWD